MEITGNDTSTLCAFQLYSYLKIVQPLLINIHRLPLAAFAFPKFAPTALQGGTFNTSPTFITLTSVFHEFAASKAGSLMPNFSFAIMIGVFPATAVIVGGLAFEHVAVGSARWAAAGATHSEVGI